MKIIQRDHKLPSYKLDEVSSNFIRDSIISTTWSFTERRKILIFCCLAGGVVMVLKYMLVLIHLNAGLNAPQT
jgi:hypothetical protein